MPKVEKGMGSAGADLVKTTSMMERALRNVSEQVWKSKLSEPQKYELVASHISSMERILPGFKYEYFYAEKIASTISGMETRRTVSFLSTLEAIAYFYSETFESEAASLIIAGLLSRPDSPESAARHHKLIVNKLSARTERYKKSLLYYENRITALYSELSKNNSGILRFFRRGRIEHISKAVRAAESRYRSSERRFRRSTKLLQKISSV